MANRPFFDPSSLNQEEKRLFDDANQLAEKGTADWSDDDWQRAREIARESLEGEGIFEVEDEDVYSFPPVIDWVLDAVDNPPLLAQCGDKTFKIERSKHFQTEKSSERFLDASEWIQKASDLLLNFSDEPHAFKNPEQLTPETLECGATLIKHTEPGEAYTPACALMMEWWFTDFAKGEDPRKLVLSIFLKGALARWIEPDEDTEAPHSKREIEFLIKTYEEFQKPNIGQMVKHIRLDDGTVEKTAEPMCWEQIYALE